MSPTMARSPVRIRNSENGEEVQILWATLESAFDSIHARTASHLSFEHLYRTSYKIVVRKESHFFFTALIEYEWTWLRQTVSSTFVPLVAEMVPLLDTPIPADEPSSPVFVRRKEASETFLSRFSGVWADYCWSTSMISDICMYLDKTYIVENRPFENLFASISANFRRAILEIDISDHPSYNTIYKVLAAVISEQILAGRLGAPSANHNLIRPCIFALENVLGDGHLFSAQLQTAFLDESAAFYADEAARLLHCASATAPAPVAFCKVVRRRLLEEELRSSTALPRYMEVQAKHLIEDVMLRPYVTDVLALDREDMHVLLDRGKISDIAVIYEVMSRVEPGVKALAVAVGNWISTSMFRLQRGETQQPDSLIVDSDRRQSAAELKKRADKLLKQAFHEDVNIKKAIESALLLTDQGQEIGVMDGRVPVACS